MTTAETRRNLAQRNQTLRDEYNRLNDKKNQIVEHLATILKRCKQMDSLKKTLSMDLDLALQKSKELRNKKSAYIQILKNDIRSLQDDLVKQATQFKKLQGEYQICLQDYDSVLKLVTDQIEVCKVLQADINLERQSNASMKTMIFDYQRLKRVLEEERKYFKELSSSEQKSHEERVNQLKKILAKLNNQQLITKRNITLYRYRSGLNFLHRYFNKKLSQYSKFIRGELTLNKKMVLGIKIFKNCLQLGNLKHKMSTRKIFYKWHHNVFPKQNLRNLVEQATKINIQSLHKLSILNRMIEKTYDKNMAIFHVYEKGKYLSIIANKASRKDLHYGFNKWRENYFKKTQITTKIIKLFMKVLPKSQKRTAFKIWRNRAALQNRLLLANNLLDEYLNTKQLSRMFRKWRLEIPRHQLISVDQFIFNVKLRNKIMSRITYQKRKSKILTSLAFKVQKIKLRNYFTKYWANVKLIGIQKQKQQIETEKNNFSQMRASFKNSSVVIQSKNKKISLKVFRVFMMNSKLRPTFKKWRNNMLYLRKRSQQIFHLALRKQEKLKIIVMNQFRKCVQYFQKKEMHQVLTDLNNKMEAINQKSTNFRQRLKKCIEDLGIMASKKVDMLFNYTVKCQQGLFFDTYIRKRINKLYREYILHRFNVILSIFGSKKGFNEMVMYVKQKNKGLKLEKLEQIFLQMHDKRLKNRSFYALKGMLQSCKKSFKIMGHSQNILMFYRMASAFVAIQRKNCAQKIKGINKKITNNQAILKTKEENILNLEEQRKKLQISLKKIFAKFVNFENRNIELKEKLNLEMLTRRYFEKYRERVQQKIYAEKILIHFSEFVTQKNKQIFWKGANAIRYENTIALVKQQLAKINKKKKAFQDKSQKGRGDTEKKLQQSQSVHLQKFTYYDYYLKKFQNTLKFYESNHYRKEKLFYMRQIFNAWKKEYKGAKGLVLGTNKILQRNLVHASYQQIVKILRKTNLQLKSQLLCVQILQRKANNCMKDCILLWRCNLRKLKSNKLDIEANKMIESREQIAEQCKTNCVLVAQQRVRMKKNKILATCFMAFKTQLTQKVYEQRYKILPSKQKYNQRLLKTAIKGLKWLMFYKKTKRSYLKYKKQKFQRQLKNDVFLVLKIYRSEHYLFVNKIQGAVDNIKQQYLRFALDKIINVGSEQRDKLNYERRRALRHIIMNKVTKVHLIKRKLMTKWHAWLIPRYHYLPNILKNLQISALRRYFANIREFAYWNPIYIKKAADTITSQGYTQINATTNNLVKEGFDPQQIKQYLTKNNEKDTKSIKSVVSKIKTFGSKQDLVRAWNSWKQYLVLKSKIRKSLSKVINIAQGLGRYWNRWKSKDPQFNAILEKESRGNMLERYRDLGRLLKQYKRDVKDSKIYCQQLKEVNDEYAQKNEQGIKMALSALSSNLKKGMKQGLQIWRNRLKQRKRYILDQRYEQLTQGISIMLQQKNKLKYKLIAIQQENKHMKQKCNLGKQCGQILQKLLRERDSLSIDLADKQHNMKLLLQDNLRLKQKIRIAKQNAEKLITKVQSYDNMQEK